MAPKRSVSNGPPPVQKRTRFASPGNDPANFAEEVAAALEDPLASRKGRVKTEGYESDSTDDGEGVVESRKKGKKEKDDEDDDMFAMGEEEEEAAGGKKKKEFLRLGDIEGQEFGDTKASGDELSEDSDQPEDDDDAERRRKAGMGFELSSFNMREEMEEGKFDADGTFIRTYDAHAVHDRWMEGLDDERVIKKARKQKKMRERQEREREEREEREAVSKEDAERELATYIQKGETVLEALQRLGAVGKKVKGKMKQRQSKRPLNDMDIDAHPSHTGADVISPIQEAITRITDLASILMSHGNLDIYNFTYEQLLRSVRSRGDVDPNWVPASQQARYEYRWAVEGSSEEIYGPYSREEVLAWYNAQYFGEEGEKIKIRKVGDNNWHEWDEVIF